MSLRYRDQDGNTQIISGLTPGGDIEAGAVMTRTGTFTNSQQLQPDDEETIAITFDSPMPDADYNVDISANMAATVAINVSSKSANGFTARIMRLGASSLLPNYVTFIYVATKTYTVQHAAQNAADIAEIKAAMPAGAGTTNKLTTTSQLNNAVNPLTTAVSDIQDVVPSDATITNKLVSKATLDSTLEEADEGIWKVMGKNSAKNLITLPYLKTNVTHRGVTFTAQSDGTITFSGTPDVTLCPLIGTNERIYFPAGTYVVSDGGYPYGGVGLYFFDDKAQTIHYSGQYEGLKRSGEGYIYIWTTMTGNSNWTPSDTFGYEKTFTLGSPAYVRVQGRSANNSVGQAISGTIYPMIRLAPDTDSTYQPYALTNQQITEQIAQIAPAAQSISNPNLLDNPWFTVNQRGFTSDSFSVLTYCVDRWQATKDITLTTNGLTIAPNNGDVALRQTFELSFTDSLLNKTVCASALLSDGTILSGSANIGTLDSLITLFNDAENSGLRFVILKPSSGNIVCQYASTKSVTIRAVKLELGSVSTLANDIAPNYATELLKCQRYQYVVPFAIGQTLSTGVSDGNGAVWFPFSLPTPLRTQSGKWSLLDGTLRTHGNGVGEAETNYAPIVPGADYDYYCYGGGNIVHMQAVSIQPMTAYTLDSDTGGTLLFDANI